MSFSRLALPILAILGAAPAYAALSTSLIVDSLTQPLYCTAPAGDLQRLFVVEQGGMIQIVKGGVVESEPFLDLEDIVVDGGERGLLGLAFDPDFDTNRYFYVYYTGVGGMDPLVSYLVRYEASAANPDRADTSSAHPILSVVQPYSNHNGGSIHFGPDGYLYWGLGDGGISGGASNPAIDPQRLLGKMLRLDVSGDDFPGDASRNYAIPATNPYVGDPTTLDEIWSSGWRNPYRWSFDRVTGDMYVGDVGEGNWEEVSFEAAGGAGGRHFGWSCYEGNSTFNLSGCSGLGPFTFPVHEYSHTEAGFSCSITGGAVYRGANVPEAYGLYFFADWCSNQIYSLRVVNGVAQELTNRTTELTTGQFISQIVGFGEDGAGELYLVSGWGGIHRLEQDATDVPTPERPTIAGDWSLAPNPFRSTTSVSLELPRAARVEAAVYDATGRLVRTFADGTFAAGPATLRWDGRDGAGRPVAPGVYFVRVAEDGFASTRRVVRLR